VSPLFLPLEMDLTIFLQDWSSESLEVEGEPLSLPRKFVLVLHISMDSRVLAPVVLSMMLCFVLIVFFVLFEPNMFRSCW
jgi:hypothetical protein